jgi:hypothetical protein
MRKLILASLVALFAAAPAGAAGWYGDVEGNVAIPTDELSLHPQKRREAYWIFESGEATTTSGPVLDTLKCDRIDTAAMFSGATGGVKTYESGKAQGTTEAVANLPQLTSDFDNDGIADDLEQNQTTIARSGLRNFIATGMVVTITTQCSSGTCAYKVQCAGHYE